MPSKLALLGGTPVLAKSLPLYRAVSAAEERAVLDVMREGSLSGFLGAWGDQFLGGHHVQNLEKMWSEKFRVAHSVSMNSATSGLFAAMGAVGIGPGDEVIVPPCTMSATVMAPLIYGGIPVFVDIEPETFCLDIEKVRGAITSRTRAVIAVNLFGHPARLHELKDLCDARGIFLIEDNAQGPLAMERGRYAGTIGHIGVFSLNVHKHIQCGEGGICVTDDPDLALRLQLIRNHGENAVEPIALEDAVNIIGFNYRMNEVTAAIAEEQLRRIEDHVGVRVDLCNFLSERLRDLEGLTVPVIREECRHVYYGWIMRYDNRLAGISRELFCKALNAEGFPHFVGYVKPLYRLPIFQNRIAIGKGGFPFNLSDVDYSGDLCPVAEHLYHRELIGFGPCAYDIDSEARENLVEAVRKVHRHRYELAEAVSEV